MPELPEAETMARDLQRRTPGLLIADLLAAYPPIIASDGDLFREILVGQTIVQVGRLGKLVRFDLSSGAAFFAHLKMTGQFALGPWPGSLEGHWPPHARVAFLLKGVGSTTTLFYKDVRKFGRLRAFAADKVQAYVDGLALGPDPLTVDPQIFHKRLSAQRGRLKGVLLDQKIVAGFGNIYADESLFAAGLSPLRSAASLSEKETSLLLTEARRIMNESIKLRGSTVDNYQGLEGGGSYQDKHQAYGKGGKPCPKCGQPFLKVAVLGRSTVYCPVCQN
ncbi:MAG: bifunctional DNA-formamidopyrimidine glycosylase/DNA-(apurinic or apyrimidinic site) lyase [Deltaproteobacteria bacterium]|jgi:formamidopyrimidine-DNA glycosylase|nr:bifunctional DNA-formamidopyrimidine glycosylase/DNA-(apurinic or apyrimidinic site) lyase [Deltaproteobacteria bacterium]